MDLCSKAHRSVLYSLICAGVLGFSGATLAGSGSDKHDDGNMQHKDMQHKKDMGSSGSDSSMNGPADSNPETRELSEDVDEYNENEDPLTDEGGGVADETITD